MLPKTKKRKWCEEEMFGEFKKIKPPIIDGEFEEGAQAWLLNMGKYSQIYNNPGNLRARLSIYKLNHKDAIWW